MHYCTYYQAVIQRELCWQFTAFLRSYEHLAFDRTIDVASSTFEFFVPPGLEEEFLALMAQCTARGLVSQLQKLPNRLEAHSTAPAQPQDVP
jgi:hypothetical protein